MMGNRWTLLLLPDEGKSIRQYSFSRRTLRFATGGFAVLGISFGGMAIALGMDGVTRFENELLRQKNGVLMTELATIRSRVGELEASLDRLQDSDADLRAVAGLESIDEDILRVGVGGPGQQTPQSHRLWNLDPEVGGVAFAVDYDLNVLERRARLLSESMSEATDSLRAHHELLESTPSILPADGFLSSRFSRSRFHPIHHRALPHEGVDISAPKGTPILSAANGRVVRAGWVAGYGQMVEIDHGFGFRTRYGHASKILVQVGQRVARGDIVAQVGSTGVATASHVHYEVRVNGKPQNPMNFVLTDAVP